MTILARDFMQLDGFQENSFTQWSGRITSVIYFGKTNFLPAYLRGVYANKINKIPWPSIRLSLEKNKHWVDAVVLTGGEPTLYPDLIELCGKIKLAGFPIKLCTNGSNPDIIEELVKKKLIDNVLIDVYAPLDFPNYRRVTGLIDKQTFISIRRTVSNILTSEFPHEIRTVVAHGFHTPKLIRELVGHIRLAQKYIIQNTSDEYQLNSRELNSLAFAAKEIIRRTEIQKVHSTALG